MSQTFLFEELDDATKDYLTAVREAEGVGSPGVFSHTSSSFAGCGCISGLIVIPFTLIATLTNVFNVVYDDPVRVALLQTAGLLIGGWLLFAFFRAKGNTASKSFAGHWVYLDPLHLYVAYREQVTVTRVDDAIESNFTHNYNNGAYQNSVVRIMLGGGTTAAVTLNNEQRAEQMVVYLNYLAWARGPDGGERSNLAPATLGGVAKYVAKNDVEPKDIDNNIDLDLVELDLTEVPEEPTREGRAAPNVLPYIVMILAGVGIFVVMAYVINPPVRDDAIFEAVYKEPSEPGALREYLLDERNTRHRDDVIKKLGTFYDTAILRVPDTGKPKLRDGMVAILKSLKDANQPIVSMKVTELGARAGATERAKKLLDDLVGKVENPSEGLFVARGGIREELARMNPPVNPPPGMTFPKPRTAVGLQLIDFAAIPEDAKHAHFEVTYEFVPLNEAKKLYQLSARVEIRTNLDGEPVETYTELTNNAFQESEFDKEIENLGNRLLQGLVGKGGQGQGGGMVNPFPGIPKIQFPNMK